VTDQTPPSTGPAPVPAKATLNPRVTIGMRIAAACIAAVIGVIGAVGSYEGLRAGVAPYSTPWFAMMFPLLVDLLIVVSSLEFVAATRAHSPGRHGWRMIAHTAIAGTIALNAIAALRDYGPAGVTWHVIAPTVWAVLIEQYARKFQGEWKAEHTPDVMIPARLWLRHPVDSARLWLRAAELGGAHSTISADLGVQRAAIAVLRDSLPIIGSARIRRLLIRQVRAGSLSPRAVLDACGVLDPSASNVPQDIRRRALVSILRTQAIPAAPAPRPVLPATQPLALAPGSVPAPARPSPSRPAPARLEVSTPDRDSVITSLRREMGETDTWRPDYARLMATTGKSHSWCEKAVSEARRLGPIARLRAAESS